MRILWLLFAAFVRVGLFAFGGGYAALPLIEREVVRVHHWVTMAGFVDVVAISQFTPGPIATAAATFIGYRAAGFAGAAVATTAVILPAFGLSYVLARFLTHFGQNERWQGFLRGIRPVVAALLVSATISLGRPALVDARSWLIAAAVAALGIWTRIHPILLIALGAVAGIIMG